MRGFTDANGRLTVVLPETYAIPVVHATVAMPLVDQQALYEVRQVGGNNNQVVLQVRASNIEVVSSVRVLGEALPTQGVQLCVSVFEGAN